ncbi:MAG: hypothetical protein ACK5TR_06595 [Alphaproteobacteria bacterium]|jgi:hypothetical protein
MKIKNNVRKYKKELSAWTLGSAVLIAVVFVQTVTASGFTIEHATDGVSQVGVFSKHTWKVGLPVVVSFASLVCLGKKNYKEAGWLAGLAIFLSFLVVKLSEA